MTPAEAAVLADVLRGCRSDGVALSEETVARMLRAVDGRIEESLRILAATPCDVSGPDDDIDNCLDHRETALTRAERFTPDYAAQLVAGEYLCGPCRARFALSTPAGVSTLRPPGETAEPVCGLVPAPARPPGAVRHAAPMR